MLPRGEGDGGDAGRVDGGRWGITGRPGLLGGAGRDLALPANPGAAVCGFSAFGGRGLSVWTDGEYGPAAPRENAGAIAWSRCRHPEEASLLSPPAEELPPRES